MKEQVNKIKAEIKNLKQQVKSSLKAAEEVITACNTINNSWSGSDLASHADFFYGDFEAPPHNRRFSIEWGLIHGAPDGWYERSSDDVRQKIEKDSSASLEELDKKADFITDGFETMKKQSVIAFAETSGELADKIEAFELKTKVDIFNGYWQRQIMTRDSEALMGGRKIPVHKYYWATASFLTGVTRQLEEFEYLIEKIAAQSGSVKKERNDISEGKNTYIDKNTLLRLTKVRSVNFDLTRLITLCNELDDNWSLENYHACAMLLRAIVDHVPPAFGQKNFDGVCAQYGGKSFKDVMRPLNDTAKKIGDEYLHSQISKKTLLVTKTQVNFQPNLDMLLSEVASIFEKER